MGICNITMGCAERVILYNASLHRRSLIHCIEAQLTLMYKQLNVAIIYKEGKAIKEDVELASSFF